MKGTFKIVITILVFLVFCFGSVFGQATSHSTESKKEPNRSEYKNELNLDLYSLLRSGTTTVMFRYAPHSHGAYRFALGNSSASHRNAYVYSDSSGKLNSIPMKTLDSKAVAANARVGYELRKNSGKHQLYYGLDFEFNYYSFYVKPHDILPYRNYGYSLVPFVGVKYRLLGRLSLSVEMNGSVSYRILKIRTLTGDPAAKDTYFDFAFDPLRAINVSYHF
jgi:hypothetical protein